MIDEESDKNELLLNPKALKFNIISYEINTGLLGFGLLSFLVIFKTSRSDSVRKVFITGKKSLHHLDGKVLISHLF